MNRDARYQCIIIGNGQLLLLKALDDAAGLEYWLIPGSGREGGETEEECVVRGAREETRLDWPSSGCFWTGRLSLVGPTGDSRPIYAFRWEVRRALATSPSPRRWPCHG